MQVLLAAIPIFCALTIAYCKNLNGDQGNSSPIVNTPLGKIEGSLLKSKNGNTIYAFRGVRYAEAPVGELRFQPPVPVKTWSGTYNATEDPPACPQPDTENISEDCLFLNVFTPELKCSTSPPTISVIVFFHPGGFYSGTCSSSIYGPQYLLDREVVLVVPNYRLGSLGFLSTGTKEAPGNNGMKDQVAVLKWVKNNIASFCGNARQVTIAGYSAGGLSVTTHLTSPMARGLFTAAISMSGSVFGNLPIYTNQLNLAQKQARLLNCPDSTPAEIVSCLKTKTAKDFADSLYSFDEFAFNPIWIWTPVIEPDFGQERYLIEHPIKSVQKGDFMDVNVIIGETTDEFGAKSFEIVDNATVLEEFDKDYLRIWPIVFNYERNPPISEKISKGLRKFYFPNGLDKTKRQGIADLYADGVIGFGANRGAKLMAQYNSQSIYSYLFDYHGRYTHAYYPGTNETVPYGVAHHDDLLYLFYVSIKTPFFDKEPEVKIVDIMTKIWADFAARGSIVDDTSEALPVRWSPFDLKEQIYLKINLNVTVGQKLFDERYKTWEKLIPLSEYQN